jgi:hypothetical protein
MTKLVVPPMPEFPNPKLLGQRKPDSMLMAELEVWVEKIIAHSELGWQTAQREATLADELAEALEGLRVSFLSRLGDRENEEWDTNFCNAMKALSKHKEARNG